MRGVHHSVARTLCVRSRQHRHHVIRFKLPHSRDHVRLQPDRHCDRMEVAQLRVGHHLLHGHARGLSQFRRDLQRNPRRYFELRVAIRAQIRSFARPGIPHHFPRITRHFLFMNENCAKIQN